MSTWESGLAYVTMMAHEIESNDKPNCARNGADQGHVPTLLTHLFVHDYPFAGMHNVFVHRHDLENTQLITNERGWIASVQSMKVLPRYAAIIKVLQYLLVYPICRERAVMRLVGY